MDRISDILPPIADHEMHDLHAWLLSINSSGVYQTHGFLFAINACPTSITLRIWFPAMTTPDFPHTLSAEVLQYELA